MTKLFNLRTPFLLALIAVLAIIFSYLFCVGSEIPYIIFFILLALIAVAAVVVKRKLNVITIICAAGIALMVVLPFVISSELNNRWDYTGSGNASVVGITSDMVDWNEDGNTLTLWLENVEINGENVRGKLIVTIKSPNQPLNNFRAGMRLEFTSTVSAVPLIKSNGWVSGYVLTNNLRYQAQPALSSVQIYNDSPAFFSGVRQRIKDVLNTHLDADIAALAYAMMVGDRVALSSEIDYNFQASGVTHILSVSGLHVAFLVVVLNFLLNKLLRVPHKKVIKLAICMAVLGAYCFLCGFAPSVVRASIMALLYLLTNTLFVRYDILNSMSLSALLILLVEPLMIFDIGFQLSFLSVFGLASLIPMFELLLQRLIRIKKLRAAISTTLAAQLATIPLTMLYFSTTSPYSVLGNILIVPLSEIGFIATMIAAPLAMASEKLGILLNISTLPYKLMVWASEQFARLPLSVVITMPISALFIAAFFVVFLLSSRYLILKRKAKMITSGILIVFMIFGIIAYNIPSSGQKYTGTMSDIDGGDSIYFVTDSSSVLITSLYNLSEVITFMSTARKNNVDYVFLTGEPSIDAVNKFCKITGAKKVFYPAPSNNGLNLLEQEKVEAITYTTEQEIGGVVFTTYINNNVFVGIGIVGEKRSFYRHSVSEASLNFLAAYYPETLAGDNLFGQPHDSLIYTRYFHSNYIDLVTNYTGNAINDCYILPI